MKILQQVYQAQPAQDGAGVKIHRLAGPRLQPVMNPFLMIDEINSSNADDYLAGFPEHPHRGFETITYMKAGKMKHRDHMGNEEVIGSGDVQWMTAGRGVLHSEMPEQEAGLMHGFQIWLNLPAAEKMKPAKYQELLNADIIEHHLDGNGLVRVIAGNIKIGTGELRGPMQGLSTEPVLLDVILKPNESVSLELTNNNDVLAFVYGGTTNEISTRGLGVYAGDGPIKLTAGSQGAELLLLSGNPINEPIAQYGPFVMNTRAELEQAMRDFHDPEFLRSIV
jgi:redox-sensitive bicupin YhaK (pirin superfamily)